MSLICHIFEGKSELKCSPRVYSITRKSFYRLIDQKRSEFPNYITEDFGATFKRDERSLSKGCIACKSGEWICIYIGQNCNLVCPWCPQDHETWHRPDNNLVCGAGGNLRRLTPVSINMIDKIIEKNPQISGISFSGGEPLLYLDKMIEWIKQLRESYPQIYLWFYTNGVLLTESVCERLSKLGVNEVRIDLAATNYDIDTVRRLGTAKQYFEKTCVEVPVVEWQLDKLEKTLPILDQLQVDYLNLHDLIVNEINENLLIKKFNVDPDFIYEDDRWGDCRYIKSTLAIYSIIRDIEEHNYNIITNDCNVRNYINQHVGFELQRKNSNGHKYETFENFRLKCFKYGWFP